MNVCGRKCFAPGVEPEGLEWAGAGGKDWLNWAGGVRMDGCKEGLAAWVEFPVMLEIGIGEMGSGRQSTGSK